MYTHIHAYTLRIHINAYLSVDATCNTHAAYSTATVCLLQFLSLLSPLSRACLCCGVVFFVVLLMLLHCWLLLVLGRLRRRSRRILSRILILDPANIVDQY